MAYLDLAARTGISPRQMTRYATGERVPTTKHALALETVTGIPIADLVRHGGPAPTRRVGAVERARQDRARKAKETR